MKKLVIGVVLLSLIVEINSDFLALADYLPPMAPHKAKCITRKLKAQLIVFNIECQSVFNVCCRVSDLLL